MQVAWTCSQVIELARGAEEAKARGNVSFSAEAYDVAADSYTRALELVPLDKIFDDQRVCWRILSCVCLCILNFWYHIISCAGYISS